LHGSLTGENTLCCVARGRCATVVPVCASQARRDADAQAYLEEFEAAEAAQKAAELALVVVGGAGGEAPAAARPSAAADPGVAYLRRALTKPRHHRGRPGTATEAPAGGVS
jgi:hypothetical protein